MKNWADFLVAYCCSVGRKDGQKVGEVFKLGGGREGAEEVMDGSERRSEAATGGIIGSATRIPKPKAHRLSESNCSLRINKEKIICTTK